MSSLRNALQRRNHRERAQPNSRRNFGLLEKHRDYALRAKDYNSKKARLKVLKRLTTERNPDEFYFGMVNASTRDGGVYVKSRGNHAMSVETVRGLKTQDLGYLRTVISREKRKREKVEEGCHYIDDAGGKRVSGRIKTTFDEDGNAVPDLPTSSKGDQMDIDQDDEWSDEDDNNGSTNEEQKKPSAEMKAQKRKEAKYKEVDVRMKREKELRTLERQLEEQRDRMSKKGPSMGVTKAGRKFVVGQRKR